MAQTHSLDLELSSSQYAKITDAAQTGLDITGDMSGEAWIKLESTPSSGNRYTIFSKDDDTGGNTDRCYNWNLFNNSGTPQIEFFACSDGIVVLGFGRVNFAPVTGVWYHLAFAYDASAGSVEIYVNGRLLGTPTGLDTSISDQPSAFVIGAFRVDTTPANFYDGLIKDVRVFSDLRTQSEIVADAHTQNVSDANLEGEWNFNNSYADTSGNSNTLTGFGTPTFSTDRPWEKPTGISGSTYLETNLISYWKLDEASGTREDAKGTNDLTDNNTVGAATGIINDGADFEASNSEYLSIADGSQTGLDITTDISLSLWVKFESLPTGGGVMVFCSKLNEAGAGGGGYKFQVSEASGSYRVRGYYSESGAADVSFFRTNPDISLSTGVWYHFVWTVDVSASLGKIYRNGIELAVQNDGTSSDALSGSSKAFHIGANVQSIDSFVDGVMDEIAIYNRELHYGDVLELYDAGTAIPYIGSTAYTQDLDEVITVVDTISKQPQKAVEEAITLVDTAVKRATKVLTDVVTLVATSNEQLIFTRAFSEAVSLTDTIAKQVGKAVEEAVTLVDTMSRSIARTLQDTVTLVAAVTTNYLYFSTFTEAVALTDTVVKQTSKVLEEAITLVDNIAKRLSAIRLTETITLVATIATLRTYFKTFTETVTLVATLSKVGAFARHFTETISLQDRLRGLLNGLNMLLQNKYTAKAGSYFKKYLDPK